jgi:hypothetical protein
MCARGGNVHAPLKGRLVADLTLAQGDIQIDALLCEHASAPGILTTQLKPQRHFDAGGYIRPRGVEQWSQLRFGQRPFFFATGR